MNVLGLKVIGHDTGAALINYNTFNQKMNIVAISEERLNRRKHTSRFPILSIDYCLKTLNLTLNDIDCIVFNERRDSNSISNFFEFKNLNEHRMYDSSIGKNFKWDNSKVHIINHHDAHAASAYFCSPFNNAAVLVVDSSGNVGESQSLYYADGNKLELIERSFIRGIGKLYDLVTSDILGFKYSGEAGKTMGLSAFGDIDISKYNNYFVPEFNGINIDFSKYIEEDLTNLLLKTNILPARKEQLMSLPYNKLAYEIQKTTELCMKYLAQFAWERTKCENLCIAGGVGLNCIANNKVRKSSKFKNIFIQPASDDSGISLGSALYGFNIILNSNVRYRMKSPCLGKTYGIQEIHKMLSDYKIPYYEYSISKIAELISKSNIIGCFYGGSEYGPRALGNRSIICDPRNSKMKDILNMRVKHREAFRPFAPIVLEEKVNEYFDIDIPSPYMLYAPVAKTKTIKVAPSIIHKDNTARVQTVNKDNAFLYSLLTEFYNITGVPILLNTSFNDNEPIVETPLDALLCLLSTNLDGCYLYPFYVPKFENKDLLEKLKEEKRIHNFKQKKTAKCLYCY